MNLPNLITVSRIVVLGLIFYLAYQEWPGAATLACVFALAGSISDWLDGYLARRLNQTSNLGKLMDALIDKVLVIGAFLVLVDRGHFGDGALRTAALVLVALTVLRDAFITGLRLVAARRGLILAADRWGKRKTIWQMTSICVLLAAPMCQKDLWPWLGFEWPWSIRFLWWNGLLYFLLAAGLAIFSGALYAVRYWPMLRRPATAP